MADWFGSRDSHMAFVETAYEFNSLKLDILARHSP